MATSAQPHSWKNGVCQPSGETSWAFKEKYIIDEKDEAHYVTPPSSEIFTSTVHNALGLNTLRRWPTIYDGTNSPHGLPVVEAKCRG